MSAAQPSRIDRPPDLAVRAALGRHARRFVIEELVGVGGFGRVYRAFDRRVGIDVALKLPHRFDSSGLLTLKREFRALTGLSHPNLVAFHELFATEASWFFTMDHIEGTDLLSFLGGRRLEPAEDRRAIVGLVCGLEALHDAGVLHRDLKPSNAWIDREGRAVLLDFGLARRTIEREATLAGTPAYLAPEVIEGAGASEASDAYALGVLLFEALTGRRAFEGDGPAILAAKLVSDSPRVGDAMRDAEGPLSRVVDALLARDPEKRPPLREVREVLGGGASVPTVDRASEAPIDPELGRTELLDRLEARLDGHGTAPVLVRVHGPPGIGKSTILAGLEARLRGRAVPPLVLLGRASEHETVPYALVDGAIDALVRALAGVHDTAVPTPILRTLATAFPVAGSLVSEKLGPSDAPIDPHEARRRVAAALRSAIAHASGPRGCVVMLDDAQWADADGLALLAELARTSAEQPLAIVIVHRDEPKLEPALAAFAGDGLAVAPLSESDATSLALRLVPRVDALRIARVAGGSPFLVDVLGRAGALDVLEAGLDVDALADRAVAARLAQLPRAAQTLVDVCMVAGHPVSLEVATEVQADADGSAAIDGGTLRRITDARLVHARSPLRGIVELAPYHDRLREIVASRLAPSRRRILHLSLARALEARRELDVMRLCMHYREGGELVRAAALAEVGAREAAEQLAYGRAAELYAFALAHRSSDERTQDLRVALADALVGAGRSTDAGAAYESAARTAAPSARVDLTRRAAEQFLRAGRFRHGSALLDEVLTQTGVAIRRAPVLALVSLLRRRSRLERESLRGAPPKEGALLDPIETARIDACTSGAMGLSVVDSLRSADLMSEALDRALAHGDGRRLAVCTIWQAAFAANEGSRGEARTRAWLERGRALTERYGGDYEAGCVQAASALTEFHLGRFRPALGHTLAGSRIFLERTQGTLKESSTLLVFELASRAMLGQLAALGARATELLADAEARGDRYAITNLLQGLPTLRWLAADRPARAHADLERALVDFDAAGYVVQHFMDLLGRVLTLLYEERATQARALWETQRLRVARSLLSRTEWTSVHLTLIDAWTALACARQERGLWRRRWLFVASRAEAWLARHACGWARALAPLVGASRAGVAGRSDARAMLAAARPALVAHDLGLALGCADLAAGQPEGEAWARAEGIARPERFASMLVPGFLSRSS